MLTQLREYYETNPKKKDIQWAGRIVTELRQHWDYIVDSKRAKTNMQYLLAKQDNKATEKMFKDPANAGISFDPLCVMEKVRNILIDNLESSDWRVTLNAIDPTAKKEKEKDRKLLKNRKLIEATVSSLKKSVGLPAYSLKSEKDVYAGNVEEFDSMGLDDGSDEDLQYFFEYFHRLKHTIMAEQPLNYLIEYNEVKEMLTSWLNDLLAKNCISAKCYVNLMSGAIDYKYVAPETIKAVMGRRRDCKDAPGIGYEQSVTVGEFMRLVGDELNLQQEFDYILNAVNHTNGTEYTGVRVDDKYFLGKQDGRVCSYSDFLNFNVGIGYIEWKSINARTYKKVDKNYHGNTKVYSASPEPEEAPKSETYTRKTNHYEVTYKAYYLVLTSISQKLYQYGLLNYQAVEGVEDEYSNYSIMVYKREGNSAVEVAIPFINLLEKSFKKFEWLVVRMKAPGRGFNYDSLVQIANAMYPDASDDAVGVDMVMKLFNENNNELYTTPEINGAPVGGGQYANYDIPNGLSKAAMELKGVVDYCFGQIFEQNGIAPLAQAYTPNPRDVLGLQTAALDSSKQATGYIYKTIMKLVVDLSKRALLHTQDIIKFKDRNRLPYDFLCTALGDEVIESIASMDAVPVHRYGLFIEGMSPKDKIAKEQETMYAFQNKQIDFAQKLLIDSIPSRKRAAQILAYEIKRNERNAQKAMQQASALKMREQEQLHKNVMDEKTFERQTEVMKIDAKGKWDLEIKKVEVAGEIEKQNMKIVSKPEEIDKKADANIKQQVSKSNIEEQQALQPA